jgi:alpha-tubulin suppressor-like RCC1 family protein
MKRILIVVLIYFQSLSVSVCQTWEKISCGTEFTLGIRSDGTLWAWGYNGNGQLGIGSTDEQHLPTQVGTDTDWKDVAGGGFHTIGLKKDGSLWAWGSNSDGALGDGTFQEQRSPVRVGTDNDWVSIAASWINSYAIKANGSLYGWGNNSVGQLGDELLPDQQSPLQITTSSDWKKVAPGGAHVIALKNDNSIWGWGYNASGQVGVGSASTVITPTQIGTNRSWSDISSGFEYSTALSTDSIVWTWGFNGNSQLGYTTSLPTNIPNTILNYKWKKVIAGASWCLAVKDNGTLWGWGHNGSGQIGVPTIKAQYDWPTQVSSDTGWRIVASATGSIANNTVFGLHSIISRDNGSTYCGTGADYAGQLGRDTVEVCIRLFECELGKPLDVAEGQYVTDNISVSIYPLPVADKVTVSIPMARNLIVEVYNQLGSSIYQAESDGSLMDLHFNGMNRQTPSGVYYLRIHGVTETGKKYLTTRQIIIAQK